MIENYLDKRFLSLFLIPLLLGALTVFSFQPFNLTIINFFVLPLIFYLLVYIKKKSKSTYRKKPFKKNLFIFGTCFGFGFYFSGFHWITHSLTFDSSFNFLIPFGLILIPLFLSLFTSLTILAIGPFLSLNLSSILLFSGGLALSDYLRAKILTGFPWNLWAYSFSWGSEILQILNKVGLFAFNLVIITIFLLPSILFVDFKLLKKILILFLIPLFLLIFYLFGSHSINHNKKIITAIDEKFNIKVISPNFKLEYGLGNKDIEERLNKLISTLFCS